MQYYSLYNGLKEVDDKVFKVSLETGFPATADILKKDYNIVDLKNCNIPVTTIAVGMLGMAIKKSLQWPNVHRSPHIDELEYAYENKYFFEYFARTPENSTFCDSLIAKNECSEIGFVHSGYLYSLFAESKRDLANYYKNKLKININDDIYSALWGLVIRELLYDKKTIKLCSHVPISNCAYCGELIYAFTFGMPSYAGCLDLSFGYGSCRDTSYTQFLIHDHCSIKLQKSFKGKLYCHHEKHEYTSTGKLKINENKFEKSYKNFLKDLKKDNG